jgi:hypothetical protein
MEKDYETGLEDEQISFNVTVGTPGIATTVVYLAVPDGERRKIAQSNLQSGNIPVTVAGTSGAVKGRYLFFMTVVDLGILDPENWPAATANLSVVYELSGGYSGVVRFPHEPDDLQTSSNGKIVTVSKPINLV